VKRDVVVRRLRGLRGATEARASHFRQGNAVRGQLGSPRVEEAAEALDRDAEFLETFAAALDRAKDSTSVGEVLREVEGAVPTTVVEV
jgi:hypothetical protein